VVNVVRQVPRFVTYHGCHHGAVNACVTGRGDEPTAPTVEIDATVPHALGPVMHPGNLLAPV
jgi:hypothetical protein